MEKSKLTVKPESNFGRQIIKNLPFAQWTRIENRHGGGIPDLYGIYGGHSLILPPPTKWEDLQSFLFP